MKSAVAFVIATAFMLSGCSIYPLPEDVTSFDSEKIADVVRCEARSAVRDIVIDTLKAVGTAPAYGRKSGNEMADILTAIPEEFRRLEWSKFSKVPRETFLFYKNASISYDFTIDTTETNNTGIDLTLLRQIAKGVDKIAFVGKNDRSREVKRHFRVFDTFDSLARLMPDSVCSGTPKGSNLMYPATGLTRVGSLIKSFVRQNQLKNLVGAGADYSTAQMTDTLTFRTRFTGNLKPAFTLNAVPGNFVASDLSFNVDNSREDAHTIIVLAQLPLDQKAYPTFDAVGRITALPQDARRRALADEALDRQRDFNSQDALSRIGTSSLR